MPQCEWTGYLWKVFTKAILLRTESNFERNLVYSNLGPIEQKDRYEICLDLS